MNANMSIVGREELGFREAVLSEFSFIQMMGFSITKASEEAVWYESNGVSCSVSRDVRSGEIDVLIRERSMSRGFDIEFVARVVTGQPDLNFPPAKAKTASRMRECVHELARRTAEFAMPLLRGDANLFQSLRDEQTKVDQAVAADRVLHDARATAERARMAGDWMGVVRAYEPVATRLSPMERRRLEYARKRLQG